MNGNASVERSRSEIRDRSSREPGPVTDSPVSPRPRTSKRTLPSPGRWWRNQREWWTSAGSDPKRWNSSASDARATVNSPTIRPASLSIAVRVIRPGAGIRWVSNDESHASAPGPVTRYFA